MLVLLGQPRYLCNFRFGYFVSVHAADSFSLGMYFEHDPGGCVPVEAKDFFEHADDEFHRRIVVIE